MTFYPVSDLIDKLNEIDEIVHKSGEPVFLTESGSPSLVVMSFERYLALTARIELALDEACIEND